MLIRKDQTSLFVKNARGAPMGLAASADTTHTLDLIDDGLTEGDKPKPAHVSGAPSLRIRLDSGRLRRWVPDVMHNSPARV